MFQNSENFNSFPQPLDNFTSNFEMYILANHYVNQKHNKCY